MALIVKKKRPCPFVDDSWRHWVVADPATVVKMSLFEGKWITLGGKPGADGSHEGGFPCQIDKDGNILRGGPPGLRGVNVKDVKSVLDKQNGKIHGPDISEGHREERQQRLFTEEHRKAKDQPWKGKGEPEKGKVYNVPTKELKVDPARFQFKLNTDKKGVTDELKQVKTFNPDFAGTLAVWKDPENGETYVVNGHHRHELADRLGHENLAVRYVEAKNAQEARAQGALINIAEGRGTAIDAAKFMRDMGVGSDDFEKHGISLKGKVSTDAVALSTLSERTLRDLSF